MNSRNVLQPEIDWLAGMSTIISAYEEIAASRMQKIRNKVLNIRTFLNGLNEVYNQVKLSYLAKGHHKDELVMKKNGKTLAVMMSANTGLYGDIVQKTLDLFVGDLEKNKTDVAIVGRLGKALFEQRTGGKFPFTYFDLPDSAVSYDEFRKIVDFIVNYQRSVIYHGVFRSIITQEAIATNISGNEIIKEAAAGDSHPWLFEPSLEEILIFFETEIFSSLFVHTIHESQLAKYAARMVTLDQADDNIKKSITKLRLESQRFKHRQNNRKMLGTLSGLPLVQLR